MREAPLSATFSSKIVAQKERQDELAQEKNMIHPQRENGVLSSLQRRIIMLQSTTSLETLFRPHASLAAIAAQLKARGIFDTLRTGVQIAQKTVKDSPQDKLIDILMTLLCGAQSLVQINTLLRSDPALQRSIGRERGS